MRGGSLGHVLALVIAVCYVICLFALAVLVVLVVVCFLFAMFDEWCGYAFCNVCVLVILVMSMCL